LYGCPDRLLQPLVAEAKARKMADDQMERAVAGLHYAVASVARTGQDYRGDAFLKLDPESSSAWIKALRRDPGAVLELARFVPADWGNYHAVSLPYQFSLLLETARLVPQARLQLASLPMFMQMQLGFTPEALFASLTGELGWAVRLDPTHPDRPGLVALVGLKDRGGFEKRLDQLQDRARTRLAPMEMVGGVQLLGLPGAPVRVALVEKPSPALLAFFGPECVQHAREVLAFGGQTVADAPEVRQATEAAGKRWVAFSYVDMGKVVDVDAVAARLPAEARLVYGKVEAWLPEMRDAFAATVERDGIALKTYGSGIASVTFTTGFLAGLVAPNFLQARARGQLSACESNLKNIGTACEMWSTDHGGRYPASLNELAPDYLKAVPSCPAAGDDTYSAGYAVHSKPDVYTVRCSGEHHGVGAGYPAYDSVRGLIER
ncbi:MAG: hypothetical protein AB1758_05165, partial [Candidatus Eremiobacterota bacterium]